MLVDLFGRKIDYLRLSVTDLCNIRCQYCLPPEGVDRIRRAEILSFEEIVRMVRILVGLGLKRVRLTGGEPLVRRDLPRLVGLLSEIPGLEEVLLTTNGLFLDRHARALKEAGLRKINIHLDTLLPERFRSITRLGTLKDALEGIESAIAAGFSPIKLNAVLQKGLNDEEIPALLRFAAERGLILRLIELMPIGPALGMPERFIPLSEVRERLEQKYRLVPLVAKLGSGPAKYFRVEELDTANDTSPEGALRGGPDPALPVGGATQAPIIGFITPVSAPFCEGCNRIRISSDGRFQDCLAFDGTFSFRELLRDPSLMDDAIAKKFLDLLQGKREGHEGFVQLPGLKTPCMSAIGG